MESEFDKVKEFLKQFVKSVKIGPTGFNVGVVTFSTYVHNIFWLDTYTTKNSLLEAIDKIPYIPGGTSTERGLEFVREEAFTKAHGDREDANNILVVVTDGKSYDAILTADQANKIHETDIKVIAVGVGLIDETELKTIASDEESVFEVTNFDALKSIQEGLKETTCDAAKDPVVVCGIKPADIVFLLDSSSTVMESEFDKVKKFLKQFVKSVKIGPTGFNVGVVTFSTYVHNIFWLDTYTTKNSLLEAIDKIPYIPGGTSTERGLEFVREEAFTKAHGDREDANNILIVVTDGKSYDATLTADQANKIHKTDIKVIAVGVGHIDETELKTIASDEESVFEVINFDALKSIEQGVTITACEAAVAPDDECGILSGDIVFLLDTSGSVGPGDFEKVKAFVKHMATSFMIGPDEVHMGVITFDTEIHDEFWLKEYTSESLLLQAIDSIPYHDGLTNTDMALSYARQYAFSTEHGGRDDAADILIVITDGPSTNPESTHEEAEELHKTDVTVLVIGVGEFVDKSELEIIANGKENVFDITDFSAFDTVKNTLTKTACKAIAVAPFGSRRAVAAARPYAFRDNEE